jgi:hypothetical protein
MWEMTEPSFSSLRIARQIRPMGVGGGAHRMDVSSASVSSGAPSSALDDARGRLTASFACVNRPIAGVRLG